MADSDVLIIGGGLTGLTAGLHLARNKHRVMVLEKESFGGYIKNIEWIESCAGFPEGIGGARLTTELLTQAADCGLQLELAEAIGVELYTSSRWVQCLDGAGYTADAVILAGGCHPKKLGIPGEEVFQGKGVISCAVCDAVLYTDRVVAVCGGGDSGVTEALYMTKWASKVILIEAGPMLTATADLIEACLANAKIDVLYRAKVEAITGESLVEAIELLEMDSDIRRTLPVDGILIHVGFEPNTSYLKGIVPLDSQGKIIVNDKMETEVAGVFAAGTIRHGETSQVVAAMSDGTMAALSAERFLREQVSAQT